MQSNFKPIYTITPRENKWENGTWKFMIPAITPIKGTTPSYTDIVISGNGSVTLSNAKADGLNYVKLFGGTEQRNLPSDYTELASLSSDGACCIDTEIKGNMGVGGKVTFSVADFGGEGAVNFILSARKDTTATTLSLLTWSRANVGSKCVDLAMATDDRYVDVTINQQYTAEFDTSVSPATLSVATNGTLTGTATNSQSINTDRNLYLFANNYAGEIRYGYGSAITVYGAVYLYNNGTLVAKLVPAKRNSDNVFGMYDVVNSKFLTNIGTGTLTGGSEVTPTPDTPVDIVCNNGVIKYSKNLANMIEDNITLGYYISGTGVVSASSQNFIYNKYIPVKPNTTYTLSMSDSVYYVTISEYSTENDSGFVRRNAGGTGNNTSLTITTQSTTNYIRFGSNIYGGSSTLTLEQVQAINWMFEQGSTPTAYTPYVEGGIYTDGTVETVTDSLDNTATATDLLAIGTYKDVQEVLTGEVTRNVGVIVLDGVTTGKKIGTAWNSTYKRGSFAAANMLNSTSATNDALCSMFSYSSAVYGQPTSAGFCTNNGTVFFSFLGLDSVTSSETANTWLATQYQNGTPVIIVYPLKTATTESVTGQTLTTQAGSNIIEIIQASIDNLGLEVSYKGVV